MLDRILLNWPLKLLAIGLAFAIWVSVTGEQVVLKDFDVPVTFQLAESQVLANDPPNQVTVRLRGTESLMRRIDPAPLGFAVDLTESPGGTLDVRLDARSLDGVPRGVEVSFIEPDRISVDVETRMRREVPVEPTILGNPADGYQFYGARVLPESLVVEGPASQVENTKVLRTNPIRLDGRTEPFTARVGVATDSDGVRPAENRPLEVRVIVDSAAVERRFEGLPVTVRGARGEVTVSPPRMNVTLSGPRRLLDRITPDQVRLVADASAIAAGQQESGVTVGTEFAGLPEDEQTRITVKSLSRRSVSVKVGEGEPAS